MATQHPADARGGWDQYRRFSQLIFLSVSGHMLFAVFYGLYLGRPAIGLGLTLPSLLVLSLFPLAKTSISRFMLRCISHLFLMVDLVGLTLSLIWMGIPAHSSAWWVSLWPMFVAHLIGVVDGLVWWLFGIAAVVFIWSNETYHWVGPQLRPEDSPIELMQIVFVGVAVFFGVIVRAAFDRYNRDIEQKQSTIDAQNKALAQRNETLEDMLQAVQQANLERTRMFASISHEVRTPLNGLIGFAQLLNQTSLTPQQISYMGQVNKCSDTLLQIINEVLDFSRLESTPTQLVDVAFDPIKVAHEAVDMMESVAKHKGVTIVRELPTIPLNTMGDPLRLKQVILNLLGNALKFTERGTVLVRCTTEYTGSGQPLLHVEVQDTGIGIPLDAQAHLFQPFSQASDNTMREYGGSGLGLAICKRLVDMMQGKIGVSSQPGSGSLFWFEVPIRLSASHT